MQQLLGTLPNEFTRYWLSTFPMLLSHTYHAFSICAEEPIFSSYYRMSSIYSFTRPDYFNRPESNEAVALRLRKSGATLSVKNNLNLESSPGKPSPRSKAKYRKIYNNNNNNNKKSNPIEVVKSFIIEEE